MEMGACFDSDSEKYFRRMGEEFIMRKNDKLAKRQNINKNWEYIILKKLLSNFKNFKYAWYTLLQLCFIVQCVVFVD